MFGYVTANLDELTEPQKERYSAVYCGICRSIRDQVSQFARLTLQYDMAFLALLLMSLYEPEEIHSRFRCAAHPLKSRNLTDNPYIRYAADLNVALAYYKAKDDLLDEGKASARVLCAALEKHYPAIAARWPRQCAAIESGIAALAELEKQNVSNPDAPAAAFGKLMAELMVFQEDLWAPALRELGFHLGRFIYLTDAVLDYDKDKKQGTYNPLLTQENDKAQFEQFLLLAMSRCAQPYERLPLVQDKALLDNIIYSGVWLQYRRQRTKEGQHGSV